MERVGKLGIYCFNLYFKICLNNSTGVWIQQICLFINNYYRHCTVILFRLTQKLGTSYGHLV